MATVYEELFAAASALRTAESSLRRASSVQSRTLAETFGPGVKSRHPAELALLLAIGDAIENVRKAGRVLP
jgi:hypothetical protein